MHVPSNEEWQSEPLDGLNRTTIETYQEVLLQALKFCTTVSQRNKEMQSHLVNFWKLIETNERNRGLAGKQYATAKYGFEKCLQNVSDGMATESDLFHYDLALDNLAGLGIGFVLPASYIEYRQRRDSEWTPPNPNILEKKRKKTSRTRGEITEQASKIMDEIKQLLLIPPSTENLTQLTEKRNELRELVFGVMGFSSKLRTIDTDIRSFKRELKIRSGR